MSDQDAQPHSTSANDGATMSVPMVVETPTHALRTVLYGSFFIDKTEIAIPISLIQEVVNYPGTISSVPLSPAALQGVFNLRGMIIPVLNLRAIFHLEPCTEIESQKIAIIDMEGVKVGLIFDRTSEILSVDQDHLAAFSKDRAHHLLQGVIRFDGQDRILQVLDCQQVLELDYLPRIHANQHTSAQQGYQRRSSDQRRQCISFSIADIVMAFDISVVNEIIRIADIQQSVLSSDICIGMMNLRGRVIPIVDFAKAMDMPQRTDTSAIAEKCILVIRYEGAYFGLVVDEIHNIITFYANELLPMSLDFQAHGRVFRHVVHYPEQQDALLIDHAVLFEMRALRELYHGHQNLYAEQSGDHAAKQMAKGEKRSYITFTLNEHFGLPITAISEIVSYSADLLHPPGLPEMMEGLMNLRGTMIPVINMRRFYNEGEYANKDSSKILIVQHSQEKIGLLVDSVDNIVSYYSNEQQKLPPILHAQQFNNPSGRQSDIEEAVRLPNAEGGMVDYMMLNVTRLCNRIAGEGGNQSPH